MILIHDSFSEAFRFPSGALPTGSSLTLRVNVRQAPDPCVITLLTWSPQEARYPMLCRGETEPGVITYEAEISVGSSPCLLWYRFEAVANGEWHSYGAAGDGLGGLAVIDRDDSFLVTVYDCDFVTPRWARYGVAYQIMPDRFFRGEATEDLLYRKSELSGITRHDSWDEVPGYIHGAWQLTGNKDFFGGNLEGIRQKLPYLHDLGITVLYLTPIFDARSNHKYDTADYTRIDPMFGTEEDLRRLCLEAEELGIRILLDGVFSHVGEDSVYFNRLGTYGETTGAFRSQSSPYYKWFHFHEWPYNYDAWIGSHSLPCVNEMDPEFREFILTSEDSVIRRWQSLGTSGWRLDAIEELPLAFLKEFRREVKKLDPEALVLGELWQNAARAVHRNELRCYVQGDILDSVINYPLREALVKFLLFETEAAQCLRVLKTLQQNYPPVLYYSLMNMLSTHDLPRILNTLAGRPWNNPPRPEEGLKTLSAEERMTGLLRERMMVRFILSLPGMPCIYYGDEAGKEGSADPFCRGTFPWGKEDRAMQDFYRSMIAMRHDHPVLKTGTCSFHALSEQVLAVVRGSRNGLDVFGDPLGQQAAITCINRSAQPARIFIPQKEILGLFRLVSGEGETYTASQHGFEITLPAMTGITLFGMREDQP